MSIVTPVVPDLVHRLEQTLKHLAAEVRHIIPSLRVSIQHGRNDSFPWWTVARFSDGTDGTKVIDVSIDCRATPEGWSIRADIAREDGHVLRESADMQGPRLANGASPAALAEELAAKLDEFLISAAPEMAADLVRG